MRYCIFSRDEYRTRVERAAAALADRDLDGILLFAPESHYYLCGYDTFGFAMLQCLILKADGDLHLFTRAPDLRQAQQTSTLDDDRIHIWAGSRGGRSRRAIDDAARFPRPFGPAPGRGKPAPSV